jgi:hypothetical protein
MLSLLEVLWFLQHVLSSLSPRSSSPRTSHYALWVHLLECYCRALSSAVGWKFDWLCPTWPAIPLPIMTPAALCVDQGPTWYQFCAFEFGFWLWHVWKLRNQHLTCVALSIHIPDQDMCAKSR